MDKETKNEFLKILESISSKVDLSDLERKLDEIKETDEKQLKISEKILNVLEEISDKIVTTDSISSTVEGKLEKMITAIEKSSSYLKEIAINSDRIQ